MVHVDAHCHLYEYSDRDMEGFSHVRILAVSEDLASSRRVLELSNSWDNVHPCLGVHPWNVGKLPRSQVSAVMELIERSEVPCIGEIGLDKRFVPDTYAEQLELFRAFLKLAKDLDLAVNVHAAGAWVNVLEELRRSDVDRALIHWYTGPPELLEQIDRYGYFITINPAMKVQKKHRDIAVLAPPRILLTESDGPYKYRGMDLSPTMVVELVREIAEARKMSVGDLEEIIYTNFRRFLK